MFSEATLHTIYCQAESQENKKVHSNGFLKDLMKGLFTAVWTGLREPTERDTGASNTRISTSTWRMGAEVVEEGHLSRCCCHRGDTATAKALALLQKEREDKRHPASLPSCPLRSCGSSHWMTQPAARGQGNSVNAAQATGVSHLECRGQKGAQWEINNVPPSLSTARNWLLSFVLLLLCADPL